MNKSIKMLSLVLVLLVGLVGLTAVVSADSDLYEVTLVEVDGVNSYEYVDSDNDGLLDSVVVQDVGIEAGESIDVEVEIIGTGEDGVTCDENADKGEDDSCVVDVKVKAWIGGYEYGDIEDSSTEFDIEPGVTYRKTLTLELPDDLKVDDDNDYTLYVEVYDDEESDRVDMDVFVERPKHGLNIYDVNFDNLVDAGDYLDVEIRLENLGEEKEEDIEVTASLEGVGSDTEYLEELASFEISNEDEEDSGSVDLTIKTDEELVSGNYDLTVTVNYNRGYETIEEVYTVWVEGVDAEETSEETEGGVTVSLSSTSLNGQPGESTTFTLTFVNKGSVDETYTVEVAGESQWASSSVDPSSVTVKAGETEEVEVTVIPDSDALGEESFTVQVLSDGDLVQEVEMDFEVAENETGTLTDTSSALKIAFIILIALIIIVGLIVAFRRLNDEDDDPLEPKEGQTYY